MANLTIKGMDDKPDAVRITTEDALRIAAHSRARFTGPALTADETIAAIKEARRFE